MPRIPLVLVASLFACKNGPMDEPEVALPTERIELTCTETRARSWRADPHVPGLVHGLVGGHAAVSRDAGRTWRRGRVVAGDRIEAAVGEVALAFDAGPPGGLGHWVATEDGWDTAERPVFVPTSDEWLPPGSFEAVLQRGSRVAVSDTGRMFARPAGDAWGSAPDAYAVGFLGIPRIAASAGDREIVVHGPPAGQVLWGSTDRGHSFTAPVDHPDEVITDLIVDEDGLVVAGWDFGEGGIDEGISVSTDFARTWARLPSHRPRVSLGPAPGEIWAAAVVGVDARGEVLELRHSTDGGATWARVELHVGDVQPVLAYGDTGLLAARRVFVDDAGRRVLPLAVRPDPGDQEQVWRCVEGGDGGFVVPAVSRDDAPGTVTLWDRNPRTLQQRESHGQVVPGAEPGQGVWPIWEAAGGVVLGRITAMDVNPDRTGLVALALPSEGGILDTFSTLLEIDLDGAVVSSRPWDTYGEEDGLGGTDAVPLAGSHLRVDPDTGVQRVITDVGLVAITDTLQPQIPEVPARIGNVGRVRPRPVPNVFGLDGSLQPGQPDLFLWDDTPQCGLDTQTWGCRLVDVSYVDFAVRDGLIYVLDPRGGDLWEVSPDPGVDARLVATGFLEASTLYTSMRDDTPGVYVFDHDLYRVVPGDTVAVRP